MKLMPIVYVTDMGRALDFYTALGLQPVHTDRSGMWSELALGDALLGLHKTDRVPLEQASHIELALVSEEPLEQLVMRLKAAGLSLEREITDEAFGRSILLRDPDGLAIQVNEHDTSLYT
jgi:catechol 2,3-dioxygenase-like lactoylglutathione lyase family enzyme